MIVVFKEASQGDEEEDVQHSLMNHKLTCAKPKMKTIVFRKQGWFFHAKMGQFKIPEKQRSFYLAVPKESGAI